MNKLEAMIKHTKLLIEHKKAQLQIMKDDIKQWEKCLKINEQLLNK